MFPEYLAVFRLTSISSAQAIQLITSKGPLHPFILFQVHPLETFSQARAHTKKRRAEAM